EMEGSAEPSGEPADPWAEGMDACFPDDRWLPYFGAESLKVCPRCLVTALEGEVECTRCGCSPEDDAAWRWATAAKDGMDRAERRRASPPVATEEPEE